MTLESLTALTDEELNTLAARKVMGWHVEGSGTAARWFDSDGKDVGHKLNYGGAWRPATDRNQSGELLTRMAARGAAFCVWFDGQPETSGRARNGVRFTVAGSSARSEVIAALCAYFAMEETK